MDDWGPRDGSWNDFHKKVKLSYWKIQEEFKIPDMRQIIDDDARLTKARRRGRVQKKQRVDEFFQKLWGRSD